MEILTKEKLVVITGGTDSQSTDSLKSATPRHMPVPADELEIFGLPL